MCLPIVNENPLKAAKHAYLKKRSQEKNAETRLSILNAWRCAISADFLQADKDAACCISWGAWAAQCGILSSKSLGWNPNPAKYGIVISLLAWVASPLPQVLLLSGLCLCVSSNLQIWRLGEDLRDFSEIWASPKGLGFQLGWRGLTTVSNHKSHIGTIIRVHSCRILAFWSSWSCMLCWVSCTLWWSLHHTWRTISLSNANSGPSMDPWRDEFAISVTLLQSLNPQVL